MHVYTWTDFVWESGRLGGGRLPPGWAYEKFSISMEAHQHSRQPVHDSPLYEGARIWCCTAQATLPPYQQTA